MRGGEGREKGVIQVVGRIEPVDILMYHRPLVYFFSCSYTKIVGIMGLSIAVKNSIPDVLLNLYIIFFYTSKRKGVVFEE